MMSHFELTLSEASSLIHQRSLTPTDLAKSLLDRIGQVEPHLHAWAALSDEAILDTAETMTVEAQNGLFRGPLHGIPVGIKDIYFTKDVLTECGSKLMEGFTPTFDATAVRRLREAGAIVMGKTATTEFAFLDPAPTRNPWSLDHTPGGSSSGSAAAVSAGMCPAALGSQTGGSTIRPAAFCGIVGLKPSYGRISRFGIYPLSWSLDHVGILTRTVEDAGLMLQVVAGRDELDATSSILPTEEYLPLHPVAAPKIGLVKQFFYDRAGDEVKESIDESTGVLRTAGAKIEDVLLPKVFDYVSSAHRVIMSSEAASLHEQNLALRPSDYRPKIRGLVSAGLLIPASAYLRAQRVRAVFVQEIFDLLKRFDCLVTPASVTPALKGLESTGDAAFNSPWSLCGFPSVAIPSGITRTGLPLGIQLVGRPFEEKRLLSIARWCEDVLEFRSSTEHTRADTLAV